MGELTTSEKIRRHIDFWEGKEQKRPLVSVYLGQVFFSREFEAARDIVKMGTMVEPGDLDVPSFLADYERMYNERQDLRMEGFYTAEPCTGIPWMEAIMGAAVMGTDNSFVSHGTKSMEDLEALSFSRNNPWYQKYLEFVEKLTAFSDGRFPVGQPILRGVTDTVGSLIGQQEMVIGTMMEPELMCRAFDVVVDAQRALIEDQYRLTKPFHGGYAFGFYHFWAPGKSIWFQEDLAALLSPSHFEEFLDHTYNRYIEGYDYSMVHLHPTAFFHLDGILKVKNLTAVQMNMDVEGPTVRDMAPQICRVIEHGKKAVIGMGQFTRDDIDALYDCLPSHDVAINIIASTRREADELLDYIDSRAR